MRVKASRLRSSWILKRFEKALANDTGLRSWKDSNAVYAFLAAAAAFFSSALRCWGVTLGGRTITSTLPPAFSIFSLADAENLCARTETGLVSSPSQIGRASCRERV